MKIILLTFTALIMLSCSGTGKNTEIAPQPIDHSNSSDLHGDLRDYPAVAAQENIDSLIYGMTRDNCVYPKASGFAGDYTYEYACFERLSNLISEKDIYQLIEHPNANVRLYAYHWLSETESNYLDSASLLLRDDNSRVWTVNGTTKEHIKLSDIVAAKPLDKLRARENYNESVIAETK